MKWLFVGQGCAKWPWSCEAALGLTSWPWRLFATLQLCNLSSVNPSEPWVFHLYNEHTVLLVQVMGLLCIVNFKWSSALKVLSLLCSGNVGKVLENHPAMAQVTNDSQERYFPDLRLQQPESWFFIEDRQGLPWKNGLGKNVCFILFWWMAQALQALLGLWCASKGQLRIG